VQANVQRLKTGPIQVREHIPTEKYTGLEAPRWQPPLDSPCEGPVTYPGDIKTLVKSSKERSGPTLNVLELNEHLNLSNKTDKYTCIKFVLPYLLVLLNAFKLLCLFRVQFLEYIWPPVLLNGTRIIQINQPNRCNNFSCLLLEVYVQLNTFRASSRLSSGAQQLQ
jgi:hypothetical protein